METPTVPINKLQPYTPHAYDDDVSNLVFDGVYDNHGTIFILRQHDFYKGYDGTVYICDHETGRLVKEAKERDLCRFFVEC
jgi:hypothetical protein